MSAAAKVPDLNFKYMAEGKGATVTTRSATALAATSVARFPNIGSGKGEA